MVVPANAQVKNKSADNLLVKTEAGVVRGKSVKGITVFKNIPYAAAPVGALRFAAPVKPAPWNGVRDAIKPGPTAPYPKPKEGDIDEKPVYPGWVKGNEFLTVNV